MAFEHNPNRGSVFRNERKTKSAVDERKPDFTGTGKIHIGDMEEPVEVWISMWQNPPANGKKGYFSLAFNEKEEQSAREKSKPAPADFDEDIPF